MSAPQRRFFSLQGLAGLLLSGLAGGWGLVLLASHSAQPPVLDHKSAAELTAPAPVVSPAAVASPRPGTPTPATSPAQTATPTPVAQASLTPAERALNQQTAEKFWASRPSVDALIEMRVAIAEGVSALNLSTSTEAALLDAKGKLLQTLAPETSYSAQAVGNGVQFQGTALPQVVLIEPSPSGVFYLGDRPYRGRLVLIADAGNLWAVNLVSLRSYLYSVVGSEVSPSWNAEALKTQAVAARSYALTYHFHPVHSAYDLGATERYQVYRGTVAEADSIRQAVDATAGEFVGYRGGVVESMYAASDDIVSEVFQGRGMSQLGALDLAQQGRTYKEILSHYYPGTRVGRIQQDL